MARCKGRRVDVSGVFMLSGVSVAHAGFLACFVGEFCRRVPEGRDKDGFKGFLVGMGMGEGRGGGC